VTAAPEDHDALPLTVLVPESGPITVRAEHAALKMCVVNRNDIRRLGTQWDVPGVYVLLDHHDDEGRWSAYVGKAPTGLKGRVSSHVREKKHWQRAVLVRRDTEYGFNSAQVGWLEGRLYDLLDAASAASLHNGNRPSDETLPPYDRKMLESTIEPIQRLLLLLGYDPSSADDPLPSSANGKSSSSKRATPTQYKVTVADLIGAGLVGVGDRLVSIVTSVPAEAVIGEDGAIVYSGVTYSSPSSAGSAARDGAATNGWDMWAVPTSNGNVTLSVLRARFLRQRDESADATPTPNDVAVSAGIEASSSRFTIGPEWPAPLHPHPA
jgi:hypothetical protein